MRVLPWILWLPLAAACAGNAGPPPVQPRGVLTSLGDLTEGRALHTATLLPGGKVLVAGGLGSASVLRSAELYDPLTGQSQPTGSLGVARTSHRATLLLDGTVLIVGGYGSGLAGSASAELYDAASRTFIAAGSPHEPRSDHAAVLLRDGRVLIAGGDTSGAGRTPTASAELYDPATRMFIATGSMHVPRGPVVAIRLPDGRVLVAGGTTTDKAVTASAEIYDPSTGSFTLTDSLRTARRKHAAFLLPDGRVMIVGGTTGGDDSNVLRDAEVYDQATPRFQAGPPLRDARFKFTVAALPGGRVLVAGGSGQLTEVYNAASEAFHPVAGVAGGLRLFPTASVVADSSVLIMGGYSGDGPQPSVWRYRPGS